MLSARTTREKKPKEKDVPLQKTIPDPTSTAAATNAYIVIDRIELDPRSKSIRIVASAYRDKAASDADKQPIRTIAYNVNQAGRAPDPTIPGDTGMPTYAEFVQANAAVLNNFRNACYALIKTQPELAGSVDVA